MKDNLLDIAQRMTAMAQTPGYQDYLQWLSERVEVEKGAAVDDTPDQLLYHRGIIHGLIIAANVVNDTVSEAKAYSGELKEAKVRKRAIDGTSSFD